jgi:UDP-glucose 4-epimerase
MAPGLDLVTGGAGFIGSELVRQLLAAGSKVRVLDDLSTGKRENLAGLEVELRVGSILDRGALDVAMQDVDRLFHLACLGLRRSIHDPVGVHAVNATGTLAVIEAARRHGTAHLVHVSSSEVYGSAERVPMDEDHPTRPTTPYGASKLAGEAYARAAFLTYGLPVVIVRPFNAYGPRAHHEGDSGEVIPRFLRRAAARRPLVVFGDGRQTRDFTHVSDTARGILLAGTADAALGATINLGSGSEVAIDDLAVMVCKIAGRAPAIDRKAPRPGDVRRLCADARRAGAALGWSAEIRLADGLRALYNDLRTLGQSADELLADEAVRNWGAVDRP